MVIDDNTSNVVEPTVIVNDNSSNSSHSENNSIQSTDLVKYYKNGSEFEAKFLDEKGNPLTNTSIYFIIDNQKYNRTTDENGTAIMKINLRPGDYSITSLNPITNESVVNKITILSQTIVTDLVKYYKNDSQFYVTILDGQGNPIANKNISINIDGVFYERFTNESGVAKMDINLRPGTFILTIGRNDTDLLRSATVKVLSTTIINDLVKYYMNDSQVYITVLDGQGNPVNNSKIDINIDGVFYKRTTNESGVAEFVINLRPGEYVLTVIRNDTDLLSSAKVTVLPNTIINDLVKYYMNDSQVYITVLDGQGNPVNNSKIDINIDGVFYKRTTNESGVAEFVINLRPGEYILTVIRNDTDLLRSATVNVLPTIYGSDLVKYYKNDSQFVAKLLDGQGNPLVNVTVPVALNGNIYNVTTDENGNITLDIDFIPGKYVATVTNPNDDFKKSFNIQVLSGLFAEDMIMSTYSEADFNATVLDGQGNPLKGVSVNFVITGGNLKKPVYLTKKTNENGIASVHVTSKDGQHDYVIKTSFGDTTISNNIYVYTGTLNVLKNIGNTSSNIRIAYIVGVHPYENKTHNTLYDLLPKTLNLSYCYDIYQIKISSIPSTDNEGRATGQYFANRFVVPKIIETGYDFVIDVHSNIGAWRENVFAFAPSGNGLSEQYCREMLENCSHRVYFRPPTMTSPQFVTLPIVKAGIPAILFEDYRYDSQEKENLLVQEVINAIDNLNIQKIA